jgi:hypothetical protein
MVFFLIGLTAGVAVLAALVMCAGQGDRSGDRPADARVTAVLRGADQPDEPRPIVIATVRNPSAVPVLVGLSARRTRVPELLAGRMTVTVARRTARRRYRPGAHATVGVVPAAATARFTVPVDVNARRCLLAVSVGQAGGRLRVYRLRLGISGCAGGWPVVPGSSASRSPGRSAHRSSAGERPGTAEAG